MAAGSSMELVKSSGAWLFKVRNFSNCKTKGEEITSPSFTLSKGNVYRIFLYPHGKTIKTTPQGKTSTNGKYVSLYIEGGQVSGYNSYYTSYYARQPHAEANREFNLKLSIISADSENIFKLQVCNPGEAREWGWPDFAERSKLFAKKDYFLPNDVLTISCEINKLSDVSASERIETPESQHIENLQRLVERKELGDIITLRICNEINQQESASIQNSIPTRSSAKLSATPQRKKLKTNKDRINKNIVEVKDFQIYKGILTAQNPVFEAMFNHEETVENQENSVEIIDMDPEVCSDMLYYLHHDKLRTSNNNLMKLLAVADKYQIRRLKALCEEILFKMLTKDNSLVTLCNADLYNAGQLKKATIDFIVQHFQDVKKSDKYEMFKQKNSTLALEIFEKFYEKKNSENLPPKLTQIFQI